VRDAGVAEPTAPIAGSHRRRPVRRLSAAALERFGLRMVLVTIAMALVAVPFTLLMLQVIGKGRITRWDSSVANDLNDVVHPHPVLIDVLQVVSWLGKPPMLAVLAIVMVVVLWRIGQVRLIPFVIVTPLLGSLVDTAVKVSVHRPRPVVDHPIAHAYGKSFPSGHAFSSLVTYSVILIALHPVLSVRVRRWLWPAVAVLVLAIGVSRLLLGVHFLSDVIAGYVLGLAWLIAAVAAFEAWAEHESESPP
jgi:undecaprenyl-diphosphatase